MAGGLSVGGDGPNPAVDADLTPARALRRRSGSVSNIWGGRGRGGDSDGGLSPVARRRSAGNIRDGGRLSNLGDSVSSLISIGSSRFSAIFLAASDGEGGFSPEEDMDEGGRVVLMGAVEGWRQRRLVKAPERAVQKAVTCYGGDPSRLLDICRARIVFDEVLGRRQERETFCLGFRV